MPSSSPSATAEAARDDVSAVRARIEAALGSALGRHARYLPPRRAMALLGLDALVAPYAEARATLAREPSVGFEAALLAALDVEWHVVEGCADAIPATGGVLVVGTHPTGGVEGLILGALIDARRPDRLSLGNAAMGLLPEIAARQIGVDNRAKRGNAAKMRRALAHLRAGGALMTFPAGTVAHFRLSHGRVAEAPWHPGVARLASMAGVPVLPVRVEARAGPLWHLVSPFSRAARSLLLARELNRQRSARLCVRIGRPLHDAEEIAALFRSPD